MKIDFKEKGHTYLVNGDIASISVTELLAKHKLSPDYSNVPKATLKASAVRGKGIHKDLENILNQANYEPTTEEGERFEKWVKENLDSGVGEQVLGLDFGGMLIAGTADVMGFLKNGTMFIADHKTTTEIHTESVSWQVSILDYMARKLNGQSINGKPFNWFGAKKFFVFHYDKDHNLTVKELEKVEDSEIEKLLSCELNGTLYQRKELVIENDFAVQLEQCETLLANIEIQKKVAENECKELRSKLLEEMKRQGIKSWDTGKIRATYVEQTDKIMVDSAKLKANFPQVYSQCTKLSTTSAYVKIKVRESDDTELE